jgi:hypothetical protein
VRDAEQGDGWPLIHIGYHKTGSSWVQRQLFRSADAGFSWGGKGEDSPVNRLICASPLDFDERTAQADFAREAVKAKRRGLRHVVSSERLSGHPFSGGYDSAEIARRLHATFPRGRVLVVIREQRSILASTYNQYVKAGGAQPLTLFLQPPVYRHPRVPHFDPRRFEYHRLLALYHRLFGVENVLALPHEQLRDDPRAFAAAIIRFAEVDTETDPLEKLSDERLNVSARGSLIVRRRRVNRLFVRTDVNPVPVFASEGLAAMAGRLVAAAERLTPRAVDARINRRMRATIAEFVGDRYSESNRAWSALTGIDLGAYGYDVAAAAPPSVAAGDEAVALR